MKLILKKLNPLKSQDQKRDSDGKFTAGGGGLKAVKEFNWGRAAPIVAVVGLVGGYLVYQSFAGTALYRYQYSAYQCPGFNKEDAAKNSSDSCVINSAEGMVYRMYQGAYGRSPDNSGLKFWTQKLAGDRDKPSEVAQAMLGAKPEASGLSNQDFMAKLYTTALNRAADPGGLAYWTGRLDSGSWTRQRVMAHFANSGKVDYNVVNLKMTASDNQTFVEQLYAGMFNRKGDSGGVKYWTDQINLRKQGRNNALAYFAISSEALRTHNPGFASYIKDAPQVDVVPTAKKIRDERLFKAALNANAAKKAVDPVAERVEKARGNRDLARTIASKSKPTRSDLSKIARQEKTVRAYLSRSNSVPSKTGEYLRQNRVWYVKSVDVAKYSPDLSASEIKKEYDKTVLYHEFAKNGKSDLQKLVRGIGASYKSAEKKYEAEQRRKAEEAARKAARDAANRGDGGTGAGGVEPSGSCSGVKASSSRDKIKGCQGVLGVSQDGVWGCGTEAAFRAKYPNSNQRKTCPGDGGSGDFGCPADYVKSGSNCTPQWKSASAVRCASGWPEMESTRYTMSEGATTYAVYAYRCKKADGSKSDRNFRSFSCGSGWSRERPNSSIYGKSCKRQ